MPLSPIDGDAERRNKPNHSEIYMPAARLSIRIERTPIDPMETCDGLFQLKEKDDHIIIESAGGPLYVRTSQAQELAHAILAYKGEIEADHARYVRARDDIGKRIRSGELHGFEEARVHIETGRG